MKKIYYLLYFSLFLTSIFSYAQTQEFYQLKVYSFATEAQELLTDEYLETAFLPALKRRNIENIGVFKPRPIDSLRPKKTYVLIPFRTLKQFSLLEDALLNDNTYLKSGAPYLNTPFDKASFERIESTLMKAFEEMPKMKPSKLEGPREDRVYELRSYEAATEKLYKKKVEMFNAGGEVALFDRLGFNAVFYAEVLSGAHMPNLMYMTTHANKETRDANWVAFVDSPEWKKLEVMPEYQNTVSKNDTMLLYPTEYSDY